jgi:hypothetical protein
LSINHGPDFTGIAATCFSVQHFDTAEMEYMLAVAGQFDRNGRAFHKK